MDSSDPKIGLPHDGGNGHPRTTAESKNSKNPWPDIPEWWIDACRELAAAHPAILAPREKEGKPRWVRSWWIWASDSGFSQAILCAALQELAWVEQPSLLALRTAVRSDAQNGAPNRFVAPSAVTPLENVQATLRRRLAAIRRKPNLADSDHAAVTALKAQWAAIDRSGLDAATIASIDEDFDRLERH